MSTAAAGRPASVSGCTCSRWAPATLRKLKKEGSHQALDDIRESVEELRYYREVLFKV